MGPIKLRTEWGPEELGDARLGNNRLKVITMKIKPSKPLGNHALQSRLGVILPFSFVPNLMKKKTSYPPRMLAPRGTTAQPRSSQRENNKRG